MNIYVKTLTVVGTGLILSASTLLAKERSPLEIIDKALQHTEKMDKYAFEAKITEYDVQEDGSVIPYHYDTIVKVDRPNKLYVKSKSKYLHRSHIFNNGLYSMIDYENKNYGQFSVPKNIDKALDEVLKNFDVESPMASLIYSNMDQRIKFNSSKYLGTEKVEGVACDHISFKSKHKEAEVWVTKEDIPKIKAYTTIDKSSMPPKKEHTRIIWIKNTSITDKDFLFSIPKGSEKITLKK